MVGSLHSARVLPTRSHHSCIPELEAALSDPSTNVPSTIPHLLADLHTRTDRGVLPPYPTDDASKPEWNAKAKRRSDLHEKYFEQANALLVASIPKRSGPQRSTAIYQAWYDAEVSYRTKPLSPDIVSEPYKLWCEDAPEGCRSAILADLQRSQLRTKKNVIVLMEEGEQTELGSAVKEQL